MLILAHLIINDMEELRSIEVEKFKKTLKSRYIKYKNDIFINHEDDKGDYELNIPIKMAIITKSNLLNQLANINNLKRGLNG